MSTEIDYYFSIANESSAEFKDRGSKFIAFTFPIENKGQFKNLMQKVKKLHPKASHFCFAYKIGLDNNNFRSSDAGEPSGSAGKPILNAIESKNLTNILIVVVRYFGGTLLGVPGLINAYKTSAILAIQTTQIVQKPILIFYELEFDYTHTNSVIQIIKKYDCIISKNENQLFCIINVGIPKSRITEFEHNFSDFHQIAIKRVDN